jgi:hypothetical protein
MVTVVIVKIKRRRVLGSFSPDALVVLGINHTVGQQHLGSIEDEEFISPAASAMDDSEDSGAKEPYDIQDLADALTPPPGGPAITTPIRSPSPKKKRKYEMGVSL